jgi:hypothetical protein
VGKIIDFEEYRHRRQQKLSGQTKEGTENEDIIDWKDVNWE